MTVLEAQAETPPSRHSRIDPRRLALPAALIYNPNAGQKLGIQTNSGGTNAAQEALSAEGVPFDSWPTERAGHATELAQQAVREGRELVIAAGGDGTVAEVAHGLVNSDTALGIMPLGSIMNVARTLWIPRDMEGAARTIAEGRVLAMDMGKVGDHYFLEAAGVGLDAGLFAYFNRLDKGGNLRAVAHGTLRFLTRLGMPRVRVEAGDGRHNEMRAPMVTIANSRYVGAAYVIAPEARIDDGALDVVIFRGASVLRVLFHLLAIAGGRELPPPPGTHIMRVKSLKVSTRRMRQLPVHADGETVGATPIHFEVVPAALKVIVGPPDPDAAVAWEPAEGWMPPVPTTFPSR